MKILTISMARYCSILPLSFTDVAKITQREIGKEENQKAFGGETNCKSIRLSIIPKQVITGVLKDRRTGRGDASGGRAFQRRASRLAVRAERNTLGYARAPMK
jgi:hypothetical protein